VGRFSNAAIWFKALGITSREWVNMFEGAKKLFAHNNQEINDNVGTQGVREVLNSGRLNLVCICCTHQITNIENYFYEYLQRRNKEVDLIMMSLLSPDTTSFTHQ
jgi:hypothetical protein